MTTEQDGTALERARHAMQQGHDAVARGAYRDAARAFAEGVLGLRDTLGADHPETEEALDDLRTVQEMAGVADFLDAAQLRMPGDLPDLPEPTS